MGHGDAPTLFAIRHTPLATRHSPTTIAVIHNGVQCAGRQPFRLRFVTHGPAYWLLVSTGVRYQLEFVLAPRSAWDARTRRLRWAWTHDGQRWLRRSNVRFDAILPRADLKVRRAPPIVYWNDQRVWRVCADKWLTDQRFRAVSPRTWRVKTPADVDRIRARRPKQATVLKPRFGRQAHAVTYLPSRTPTPRRWREPMVLQAAIPGGAFGRWRRAVVDVRSYVQNGRLDLAYLKVGSPNDPILNVHRGARVVRISLRALPRSASTFVRQIDRVFAAYRPRHYAVDFRYDEQGRPQLIELNHLPVLPGPGLDAERFYEHLCHIVRGELKFARRGREKMVSLVSHHALH